MTVKINRLIGATEEEVNSRKFNIFIGISLGNKWFTKENIKEYILWSLDKTRRDILVFVADGLHAINYQYKDHYSWERALGRAERVGDKYIEIIKEIINELPDEKKKLITLIRWADLENSEGYEEDQKIIYDEFENNLEFKEFILNIVRSSVSKIADRIFKDEEIEGLANYVLRELTLFLKGANYKGIRYDMHPYPSFTLINDLSEKMQSGEIFQELYEKLGRPKAAIVELEVIV